MNVAALFVQTDGHYFGIEGVDPWDRSRDARKYCGESPVIAHPPCQLWTNFAYLNFKRYGGEHNRPGNDGGCFAAALTSVRRCGGVLEHPAFSHACGGLIACWRRSGSVGCRLANANGSVRFGNPPTGTQLANERGYSTVVESLLSFDGNGFPGLIKSGGSIGSSPRYRKRLPLPHRRSFATNFWRSPDMPEEPAT